MQVVVDGLDGLLLLLVFGLLFLILFRHLFDVLGDLLDIFLEFLDILLDLADVLGDLFHVFLNFGDIRGLIVDGHLDEYREVDRFQGDDRSEEQQHPIEIDESPECQREAAEKEDRMDDDGNGGSDRFRDLERRLFELFGVGHALEYTVPMSKTDAKGGYVGAYLVQGDAASLENLIDRLEKQRIIERGDPDLYLRSYRSFGIDDARELRDRAQRRALSREGRIFAIFAPGMTADAQNALLKILEEPPAGAVFFLIVPSPHTLLPTLRSRMQTLVLDEKARTSEADAFLAAPTAKRLEILKKIYEHDEDEGRDMGKVVAFLQSLEKRFAEESPSREKTEGLASIYRARKYIGDKGSLLKALLEQMALLTPRI